MRHLATSFPRLEPVRYRLRSVRSPWDWIGPSVAMLSNIIFIYRFDQEKNTNNHVTLMNHIPIQCMNCSSWRHHMKTLSSLSTLVTRIHWSPGTSYEWPLRQSFHVLYVVCPSKLVNKAVDRLVKWNDNITIKILRESRFTYRPVLVQSINYISAECCQIDAKWQKSQQFV